jgi:succinate dehydrogenase/fumarate reductase flavoprotein subunit
MMEYDVVVVGSGAAGCVAALTAAHHDLSVAILEKTALFGGSTAISGGAIWIPQTKHQTEPDSRERVLEYLDTFLSDARSSRNLKAFLDEGPKAIDFLEAHTNLRFQSRAIAPDYHSDAPGASKSGRTIDVSPFDGRLLGDSFTLVRPPTREFMALGGMMVNRRDIEALLGSLRSGTKFKHAACLVVRYLVDRLRYPRGTRLVMGNGLSGRLLKSIIDAKIDLRFETHATALVQRGGRIAGVEIRAGAKSDVLYAKRGVVLATGGVPHDRALMRSSLPHFDHHRSVAPRSNTGDGVGLALEVGARLHEDRANPAFLAPVSIMKGTDGTETVFPHLILDRQKPGLVAVDRTGRRFVNEACSYHDFVKAMYRHESALPAYLVCDSRFLRKYGLGLVKPFTPRRSYYVRAGYLLEGRTIQDLARKIGADEATLSATIAAHNIYARTGHDDQFGKGQSTYDRHLADATHGPNPCIGPLKNAPFYAVEIRPGDIGTAFGLETDERTRVLNGRDTPILGLFACGNDMSSIFRGHYPGSGITLGPALTFGYVAGLELAGLSRDDDVRHGSERVSS